MYCRCTVPVTDKTCLINGSQSHQPQAVHYFLCTAATRCLHLTVGVFSDLIIGLGPAGMWPAGFSHSGKFITQQLLLSQLRQVARQVTSCAALLL